MNNTASIFVLLFLAITFIISVHEKLFHWKENIAWLKTHFEFTFLNKMVSQCLGILLFFEFLASIFCIIGILELFISGGRMFGFYGCVFSCTSLLLMLFGQRLAKEFDGARTIAIYFIIAVLGVFWLN